MSLLFLTSHKKEVSRTAPTFRASFARLVIFLLFIKQLYDSLIGIHSNARVFLRTAAPPVSPSNVKANKIDSGTKISVSWDPLTPEQAWGFVTSYTISYTKEGEPQKRQTSEKTVPGSESSTVIEDLDPNQDYSVSVRGDTKAGAGKVSEPASTKGIRLNNI